MKPKHAVAALLFLSVSVAIGDELEPLLQQFLLGPTLAQRLASMTINVFPFNVTASAGTINGVEAFASTPEPQGAAALALMGWSSGLQGFNMKVFTLPPCSIYLPHIHGQADELIFIMTGTMTNVMSPDMGFTNEEFINNNIVGAKAYEYAAPAPSVVINPRGAIHTNVNYGCEETKLLLIHLGTQSGFFFIPPGDLLWPPAVLNAINYTDVAASHLQPTPPMITALDNQFCGC